MNKLEIKNQKSQGQSGNGSYSEGAVSNVSSSLLDLRLPAFKSGISISILHTISQ